MFDNLSLTQVNELLEKRIENCELISDINLTRNEYEILLAKVIESLEYANKGYNLDLLVRSNSLVFASVLVYMAMYEYEGNYWDKAKEVLQLTELSHQSRIILSENVLKAINSYNLKKFEDGGYKYITPIMCHAGIPNKSLSGIFDIMLDNYDDNTLTAEALIDNIKYFIRHRVDKTVYRFITFNEDRAITFLHNLKDLVTVVENNELTSSGALVKCSYIDERIINQYYKWRSEKKIDKERKRIKNKIAAPKIKFDGISLGVYLFLPIQRIDKRYNDFIEWTIEYDNGESINISGDLYYQNGECVTEDQNIALKPSSIYKVSLIYDDGTLAEWTYDGISQDQPVIIFDEDDNIVRENKISTKTMTCILKQEYKAVGDNLAVTYYNLPNKHWFNFKCIGITLLNDYNFIYLTAPEKEQFRIEYKKVNIIELKEGKLIFNESCKKDEIPTYSDMLPKVSLEYGNNFFKNMIIDTYSLTVANLKEDINIVQSIESLEYEIRNDRIIIDLNELDIFKSMIYGEYEVRVLEGRNIKRVFTLRYVPKIDLNENGLEKWPVDKRGYIKNKFNISCPDNVSFNFTECIQEETCSEQMKIITIESLTHSGYLIGTIEIIQFGKIITFPVKKRIRNLQWSLVKEGEQKIQWQKDPSTLFIKELIDNSYNLVLKLNDDINDEYTVRLILVDSKDKVYQESIAEFRQDKLNGMHLNQFLDTIKLNNINRYFIKIEIRNKYSYLLCSFAPLIVKDKITTKNISYVKNEAGLVSISWKLDGRIDKETMELKLYNISKPWEGYISVPLDKGNFYSENNNCALVIDSSDFLIPEDGVYLFVVEDSSKNEDLFFEEAETYKPIKILRNSVYKYRNNFEEIVSSIEIRSFKDAIYYFVYCYDTDHIKTVYEKIKALKVMEEYDADILKAIYSIYKNRKYFVDSCQEKNEKIVKMIIVKLMDKFENQYNSFKIIEDLIDIDEAFIKDYFESVNRHNLKVDREYMIPTEKRNVLWNIDKVRSFMIETRSGRSYKNILTNNIIDWLNIHDDRDILLHTEQCQSCKLLNNKGCLNKYLKGKCQGRFLNTSPKLIGSKGEYDKLFNSIDLSDKRKFNKLDSINLLEYFKDDGIKLLNKSYVELLYTWSNENGIEDRSKIYEDIKGYISIVNTYIKKETVNKNFNKLYEAFSKRKDNVEKSCNTLAYYLGTVVLMMALDSFGKLETEMTNIERTAITKMYNNFRKNLKDLFTRDFALVELYVTGLGE